jgi:hypothetical protein
MKYAGKIIISVAVLLIFCKSAMAQNRNFAQGVIDTLSSPEFFGRGYLKEGDRKAAAYIQQAFKSFGMKPLSPDYYHAFSMNVNTFPTEPVVQSGTAVLQAGVDFIPFPGSSSIDQPFKKVIWVDEQYLSSARRFRRLLRGKPRNSAIVLDTISSGSNMKERRDAVRKQFQGNCLLEIVPKLTWSVSMTVSGPTGVQVLPGKLNKAEMLRISIQNEFKRDYVSRNVAAFIPGSVQPDSFVVFTAHYDHLGGMGDKVYIPGANDNASGIAMMLDMASEFAAHPPAYSVAFIAFGGEEAGLVGSYHWVKKASSLLPLNKIRFLINMDLMGSGDEGIMAVNGSVFKEEFELLKQTNEKGMYLPAVKERGKAANSDHYFFTEAGVRGFFFYLMGAYRHYHDIEDNAKNLRLSSYYDQSFLLIKNFAIRLM